MSEDFVEYLTSIRATRDTLQQGLRLYLAERTHDLAPAEMEAELQTAGAEKPYQDARALLATSSDAAEQAALTVLSAEWEDPERRPAIRAALENSRDKLPVIEAGVIAVVAMYGMYLIMTGGKKKVTRVYRDANGNYVREEIEFASPKGWLSALVDMFK